MRRDDSPLLPHGGYEHLRAYKVAEAVYDATAVFCDRFVDKRSRTHDQMVQAARSGVETSVKEVARRRRHARTKYCLLMWPVPVFLTNCSRITKVF